MYLSSTFCSKLLRYLSLLEMKLLDICIGFVFARNEIIRYLCLLDVNCIICAYVG